MSATFASAVGAAYRHPTPDTRSCPGTFGSHGCRTHPGVLRRSLLQLVTLFGLLFSLNFPVIHHPRSWRTCCHSGTRAAQTRALHREYLRCNHPSTYLNTCAPCRRSGTRPRRTPATLSSHSPTSRCRHCSVSRILLEHHL
jgi:hypothetical protein